MNMHPNWHPGYYWHTSRTAPLDVAAGGDARAAAYYKKGCEPATYHDNQSYSFHLNHTKPGRINKPKRASGLQLGRL